MSLRICAIRVELSLFCGSSFQVVVPNVAAIAAECVFGCVIGLCQYRSRRSCICDSIVGTLSRVLRSS